MLLQMIKLPDQQLAGYRKRVDWIQRYIFPGSELASISEIHQSLARVTQLSTVHSESFGLHYAETLSQWRERLFLSEDGGEAGGLYDSFLHILGVFLGWVGGACCGSYASVRQRMLW